MRLETFFEKFELFADAPGAVAKLRELVLRLAMRGRLVKRLESDGNARQIFARGVLPKGECRYEVPETWLWIPFAAVGEQRLGKMLDQKGNRGELKPYLRNTNVQWMRFQLDDVKELRLGLYELDEYRLCYGDLLICEGGEPGRCAIWLDQRREMYFQKAIHRVRPKEGILSEFLAICLQVDARNGVLAKHFTGATIKHFTGRSLREYSIPLPPIAEQKRIVAKVEELMALCDRLEAQQQERQNRKTALARASLSRFAEAPTPANLDFLFHGAYAIDPADLRKSILTLAIQGKLVPQNSNDEPAEEVISRIGKLRSTARAKEYQPVTADEVPYEAPFGWAWTRLGNITLESDSGWSPQCSSEARSGTDWGVLKVSAVSWGIFKPGENKALPPGLPSRPDCEVRAGDFLLSRANTEELVARSVVIDQTPPHLMMSDKIVRFKFPDEIVRSFINLANTSDSSRAYYARNASGTSSSMKNIGREVMCNLPIPLPPLAEQIRIVAKVDQLMALVDQLESQIAIASAAGAVLLDAAIHELLNPKPVEAASLRIVVGCHIVQKMAGKRYFGRTANMKALYLVQAHIGLDLGVHPVREAAGPFDSWIYQFERQAASEQWFETFESGTGNGNKKVEYRPGSRLSLQAATAATALTPEQRLELDRLLGLLEGKTTEEAEIIATLFAAWNDALIDGLTPDDEDIIREVRDNWHVSKQRFDQNRLKGWIDWLRCNGLVPRGLPPRTAHQPQLL